MSFKRLRPRGHARVLEPVAPADHGFKIPNDIFLATGGFPCLGFSRGEGCERVRDECSRSGAQAIVIQDQVFEGRVAGEEIDEGRLRVEAEGVVAQVDGVQVGQSEEGGQEGGERLGDLVEEPGCEDVGEVGGVEGMFGGEDWCEVCARGDAEGVTA